MTTAKPPPLWQKPVPWKSSSAKAADFFDANGNQMVGAVPEVVLLRGGLRCEVSTPWSGGALTTTEVVYSQWYKALLGKLMTAGGAAFSIIFPPDTTVEDAERCADVYMLMLNLVRQEQHS